MKKKFILPLFIKCLFSLSVFSQSGPWNSPLNIAWSMDGITFNPPSVFQDSAGVPSIIRWKGDTLMAAFQWFRLPNNSSTWDRVAVKFSYDAGLTWTQPVPIILNGLPSNYQRPFDPSLTVFSGDSIRIYFSSSNGIPQGGLDSTVNTYSAKSADGIHFDFELNPRVDEISNRVIDPSVIYFNSAWHYLSPIGSPQQGAYHYVSPNGLTFSSAPTIPSDNMHNWTGNYMQESNTELRFYGCGPTIWYNASPNGGTWSGYVNTNLQGGDPSVVKLSTGHYLMVFVGSPYSTGISQTSQDRNGLNLYPNPFIHEIHLRTDRNLIGSTYSIYDCLGRVIHWGEINREDTLIQTDQWMSGLYMVRLEKTPLRVNLIRKE